MPRDVKIFGERNTSTNAVKLLIETNSASRVLPSICPELPLDRQRPVLELQGTAPHRIAKEQAIDAAFAGLSPRFAWKHTATLFPDISSLAHVAVVFCVRDPTSWALGLWRHPYHRLAPASRDFAEFLTIPWSTLRRDNLGEIAATPAQIYNAKIASYLTLMRQLEDAGIRWQLVRFEDFACDQAGVFHRLKDDLLDPCAVFSPVTASTKETGKTAAGYADYYGRRLWEDEVPADAREILATAIDWAQVANFAYRALEP